MAAAATTARAAPPPPPARSWWAELACVLPRTVAYATRAGGPARDGVIPPLAANPLTWASVGLDELAISAAYLVSRSGAEEVSQSAVADARRAVELLDAAGVLADPSLAHPAPAAPARMRVTSRRRPGLAFEHVSYPSTYAAPVELPGAERWHAEHRNATAHAYLLRADPQRPWAVVLHGHRMGEPRDLWMLGSLRLRRELGVNVAHLVLPMHGPRGRTGAHPFPGVDPVANFYGVAQATSDARALLAWLRAEGATRIGVFGISLGGHIAALLAGLDGGLAGVVVGVPTADLAGMLADTMRGRWGESAVAASHVLDDASRALSRVVSPVAFPCRVAREHRFIYAAIGDRLVTPQQAIALWEHWDRPAIRWLQGGHIANNVGAARRYVADALLACGVGSR